MTINNDGATVLPIRFDVIFVLFMRQRLLFYDMLLCYMERRIIAHVPYSTFVFFLY